MVVDSNVALASGELVLLIRLPEAARAAPISQEAAAENVAYLRTQVESWLAVLFNVFSSAGRDSQGPVGDVISTWLAIAEVKVRSCAHMQFFCAQWHRDFRTSRRRTTSL